MSAERFYGASSPAIRGSSGFSKIPGVSIDVRVFGAAELARAFRNLSYWDKTTVIQRSAEKSLRPLKAQAKINLKSRHKMQSGNLLRSIQIGREKGDLTGAFVKARRVRGRYYGFHSHLLDLGTAERYTKSGAYRGKIEGSKFWADAVRSQSSSIDLKFQLFLKEELGKKIEKELAKARR